MAPPITARTESSTLSVMAIPCDPILKFDRNQTAITTSKITVPALITKALHLSKTVLKMLRIVGKW